MDIELKLLLCDFNGNLKFKYGDNTITSTCKKIFKWKSETIDRSDKVIVEDIERKILNYKRLMDRGVKRVWTKK